MQTDKTHGQTQPKGPHQGPHVETVRFRLLPEQTPETFLAAVDRSAPVLANLPGFRHRFLSADAEGWQDVVIWNSLDEAMAALPVVMASVEVAPMMAAIDPATIEMRHAPLLHRRSLA